MPKRRLKDPATALGVEINRWALAHRRAKHYSQLRRAGLAAQIVDVLLRLTVSVSWGAADRRYLIHALQSTEVVLPTFGTVRPKLQRCRQWLEAAPHPPG
jgi:hypothetical protein